MHPVLILGTGTDVGKTYVSLEIGRALRAAGQSVRAVKPIETGVTSQGPADARALEAVSNLPAPTPHPGWSFEPPLSPHLAARLAGVVLTPRDIETWLRTCLEPRPGVLLVETAGGAFTPLGPHFFNADLATLLPKPTVVLVVPDKLGALHSAIATSRSMLGRQTMPDWVLFSAASEPDHTTGTNAAEYRLLGEPGVPATVRRNAPTDLLPLISFLGSSPPRST